MGALDKIVARLRHDGRRGEVLGYNEASADIVDWYALHDKTGRTGRGAALSLWGLRIAMKK